MVGPKVPERLAIVIGREADGVSPAMLQVTEGGEREG